MCDFSCDREVDTNQNEAIIELVRQLDELTEERGELVREKYINGNTDYFPRSKTYRLQEIEDEMDKIEGVINLEYSLLRLAKDPESAEDS